MTIYGIGPEVSFVQEFFFLSVSNRNLKKVLKHLQDVRETGIEGRVLSITELYRLALELVLHVGDAGKRKRRQGQDSREIVRVLKTLGKPEMRMLLQDLSRKTACELGSD